MTSILVPGHFTDASMPTDLDLKTYIATHPDLTFWAQADGEHATVVDGKVVTFGDVRGGVLRLSQGTVASQVALVAQSAIRDYTAAVFDGVNDRYDFSGTFDAGGTFTLVGLAAQAAAATGAVCSNYTGTLLQTTIYLDSAGRVKFTHRGLTVDSGPNIALGEPVLVIATGTPTHAKVAVNGGAPVVQPVTGSPSTGVMHIGALSGSNSLPWNGWISDCLMFSSDLFASDQVEMLAMVRDYFRETYALSIS